MANYLMSSEGAQAIQPTEKIGRGSIIDVNAMYKMRIFNKSGTIKFTGFIPPDFSFALASNWTSPYSDTTLTQGLQDGVPDFWGGVKSSTAEQLRRAQTGLTLGGGSSFMKALSAQKWSGPDYLGIDLPIFLDAYEDTKTEVVQNILYLLSLCAPSELAGALVPPGPSPIGQVANSVSNTATQVVNGVTGSDYKAPEIDDKESFTLEIGNFFSMSPCIVKGVTANFDNVWEDGTGNPISVDFVLNVQSYFAVTREDLAKWLKLPSPAK